VLNSSLGGEFHFTWLCKELIWLEGGHGLNGDNIDQFVDVMVNRVLAETCPAN
jgi:hypothetical protein